MLPQRSTCRSARTDQKQSAKGTTRWRISNLKKKRDLEENPNASATSTS
jgi:hypothetical protein